MTSRRDIYTWIADYACKYRLEDLISELFTDVDGDIVNFNNFSHINLRNALVWMAVKNDCQEELEDAVMALDSILNEAIASNSLQVYIRLALGLRLKDLSYSLSLPRDIFEQKLKSYFPRSKLQLEHQYLSQVFSEGELEDFEKALADVCKYFQILNSNETQKKNFFANYPQSHFGNQLTKSLKSLTEELFDKLAHDQPLCQLEQMVKFGVGNFMQGSSSPWHEWLIDMLSDVHTLDDQVVRHLMISLQWYEAVRSSNFTVIQDGKENEVKRPIRSATDKANSNHVKSVQEVALNNNIQKTNDKWDQSKNSSLDGSMIFVPSSQGEPEIWSDEVLSDRQNDSCSESYSLPNLQQFLKRDGTRGCVVKLHRM